jgi:hypothetical protein
MEVDNRFGDIQRKICLLDRVCQLPILQIFAGKKFCKTWKEMASDLRDGSGDAWIAASS